MTWDEMKLERDGQLSYGPAVRRTVVEERDGKRVTVRYELAWGEEGGTRKFGDRWYFEIGFSMSPA